MITVDQNTQLEIGKQYRIVALHPEDVFNNERFKDQVATYVGYGPLFKFEGDPMHYCFLYGLTVEEL